MNLEKLNSTVSRIFFFGSFLLLAIAVLEFVVNLFGYTFLRVSSYTPGRLLQFAAISLIFVIALLLRQVREELKKTKTH